MQLKVLCQKCDKAGVLIDDRQIVLKITENMKKGTLLTSVVHKAYNELPNYNLNTVTKFWVKKYKTHNTYD
jgi:hypothetical protein